MSQNELGRWALCHLLSVGVPAVLVWFVYGDAPWAGAAILLTVVLTASWGSWSSLQITRDETLRSLSRAMAGLWPAIAIPIVGAVFLLENRSPVEILILLSTVLGTSSAAFMMTRRLRSSEVETPELISAFGLFPLMTTLTGWLLLMAGFEFFDQLTGPIQRALVSTMLLSLVTTMVPAATAWGLESVRDPIG